MSGLSARHIAKIEKGVVNPSFEALLTLASTRAMAHELMGAGIE